MSEQKKQKVSYVDGAAVLHSKKGSALTGQLADKPIGEMLNPFSALPRLMSIFNTHEGDPHMVGHVVGLPLLTTVFIALLGLTGLTYAVTYVDLGPANLFIALFVAVVKATLVVLYFMHLRWERPMIAVTFISALLGTVLFIGIALLDTVTYQPDLKPGYSPEMEKARAAHASDATAAPAVPAANESPAGGASH
jgi:cytochrome c oxidase subunit 4